jgi:hypothetical protein
MLLQKNLTEQKIPARVPPALVPLEPMKDILIHGVFADPLLFREVPLSIRGALELRQRDGSINKCINGVTVNCETKIYPFQ